MDLPPQNIAEPALPSDTFIEKLRECLEHIYDLPFLQSNPISIPNSQQQLGGKPLRIELMRMIENLNPGPTFSLSSREARSYNLLRLRYLQKMGVEEIANMLSVSARQAYRDLRVAEDKLGNLVWEKLIQRRKFSGETGSDHSTNGELSHIPANLQSIDLIPILHNAIQITRELANQRRTYIRQNSFPEPLLITTDPTIAQQLMVSMVSYTVRQVYPGTVIDIIFKPLPVSLIFQYTFDPQLAFRQPISAPILQLAERLNWSITQTEPSDLQTFTIELNQKQKVILIIEDNEGVVELFRRYLTDEPVSVISSANSLEGLRLAGELIPDMIILDVMMKGVDGWEILRRIKLEPHTSQIPVVICSVFFEPDLAKSLGATAFLIKPVTQINLFSILREQSIL